jgi:hypothetical protein
MNRHHSPERVVSRAEPQPVDRNPAVACVECGNVKHWKEWQEQYNGITRDTELRCEDCQQIDSREQATQELTGD